MTDQQNDDYLFEDELDVLDEEYLDEIEQAEREARDREGWTGLRQVRLGAVIGGANLVGVPVRDAQVGSECYFTELDGGGFASCINDKTRWKFGMRVKIGHPPDDKDWWHVHSRVNELEKNQVTNQPGTPPHSEDHTARNINHVGGLETGTTGSDIVFIDARQVWDLGIFPYSGMQARINAGWVNFGGKRQWLPNTTLTDQTSNIPSTSGKSAWVLVQLDSDLTFTYTKGDEFTAVTTDADAVAYMPAGEANTYQWAMLLTNGDTALTYAVLWNGLHWGDVQNMPIVSITEDDDTTGPGIYEVDTSVAAVTLTITSADIAAAGRRFLVKDITGDAATNNLTIDTEAAETIEGAADFTIDWNSGSLTLYTDGSNLHIIGSIAKTTMAVDVTDVSSPPTDAELDAALGTPAAVGAGYYCLLDDNDADSSVYLVASNGTSWWYTALTKAT